MFEAGFLRNKPNNKSRKSTNFHFLNFTSIHPVVKRLTTLVLLSAGLASISACEQEATAPTTTTFTLSAALNGKQEVAVNSSTASGTLTGSYDKITRTLSYKVTYQSITPLTGHIHQGTAGSMGR